MCQTVHSVLGIQQGTKLLVSTEAYNLLEKRITKGMSVTKETDCHLHIYKRVVCMRIYVLLVPLGKYNQVVHKKTCKDAYEVRILKGQNKPSSC